MIISVSNSTQAERFFSLHSTWYERIPADPTLDPNSANYVQHLDDEPGQFIGTSQTTFSSPLWYATESTPLQDITIRPSGGGTGEDNRVARINNFGWNLDWPVPAGSEVASGADGHIFVISADRKTLYDGNESDWPNELTFMKIFDLTGDGIMQPWGDGGSTDPSAGNASVSPVTRLHGIVTYAEVEAGVISHCMAMVMSGSRPEGGSFGWVYPCVTTNKGWLGDWAPFLGHRFQLDPTLDLEDPDNFDGKPLSTGMKVIAKAMQDYGFIYMENGGASNVYLEDLEHDATRDWSDAAVLIEYNTGAYGAIKRTDLRLITPLIPQCNDGIDNNGDGNIDYPDDPTCYSLNDWYEGEVSVGIVQDIVSEISKDLIINVVN